MVGLETDCSWHGSLDLSLGVSLSWEERSAQLDVDEDLGVEDIRSLIEWDTFLVWNNIVSACYTVGATNDGNGLLRGEAEFTKAREDVLDTVEWLGDEQVGCGSLGGCTAHHEWDAGCTVALSETDGAGELDEVTSGHDVGVLEEEWPNGVEDIVDTGVGVEGQFGSVENSDGTISSSTTKSGRDGNSVVEKKTESTVRGITTLALEEVLGQVLNDGNELAASAVGDSGSVGANSAPGDQTVGEKRKSQYKGGKRLFESHCVV